MQCALCVFNGNVQVGTVDRRAHFVLGSRAHFEILCVPYERAMKISRAHFFQRCACIAGARWALDAFLTVGNVNV